MRVTLIGVGNMGEPMAANLVRRPGFELTLFDADGARAAAVAARLGCRAAVTLAEAARCEVCVTMLPTGAIVTEVLTAAQDAAFLGHAAPGTVVVDMSSSEPMRTRALADTLSRSGVALVDAPVSGGVKKARDGSLAIMFGGTETQLAQCTPLLSAMGGTIFRTGEVGSGHAMKALNNFVSAAGLVAAVEALHIGEKFGLDPHVMTRILNASTGKNNTTENKVEQFMLSGKYDSGFGLALMEKDVGIAVKLAEALGVAARQGILCHELWAEAARKAKGADHTEMYRLL